MIYLIYIPKYLDLTTMVTKNASAFCCYDSSIKRRTFLTSTIARALRDTRYHTSSFDSIDDAIDNLIACTALEHPSDFVYITTDTHPEYFL